MRKNILLFVAMIMATCVNAQVWQSELGNAARLKAPAQVHKATITPSNGQVWWGYMSESDLSNGNTVGIGSTATYMTAIHVAANHEEIGSGVIKAVRVYIGDGLASTMSNMKIWISSSLPSTVNNADYVQSITTTLTSGANDFKLTTPYSVNNREFYIGYSVKSTNGYPIFCCGASAPDALLLSVPGSIDWEDLVNYDFGKLGLQLLVEGGSFADNSVSAANFERTVVEMAKTVNIPVSVTNEGATTVTSISYTVTMNGSTSVEKEITSLSIPYGSTQKVEIPVNAALSEGENNCTITITKVNGNANNSTRNTASGPVVTVASLRTYPRTVLIEEFTTENCGNCPRAVKNLNTCLTDNPDLASQVAVVCHHSGYYTDWLTIPADESYTWFFKNVGYTYAPAFMWDRHAGENSNTPVIGDLSAADNKTMIEERLADTSYAQILLSTSFNSNQSKLTVNATCERGWEFCSTPERVTLILTEDNIAAKSQSGGGSNFIHQHVSRAVNDTWGAVLSWSANKATYSYTFNVDSSWKIDNLKVVGFISGYDNSDPTNCEVENAAVVKAGEATAIQVIDADTDSTVTGFYTIDGRRVDAPVKGVNIVRYSNGTAKKVVMK